MQRQKNKSVNSITLKTILKFLFLFFVLTGCKDSEKKASKQEMPSTADIQKIKLSTLNGELINMKQYTGKAIFINFWATWCKPCIEEMPTIKNAIDSLKDRDIQFLFASDESTEQIESFEREHHFGFNYVKTDHMEELGIVGLPTSFIFNKEGKKIFSEIGYRKWNEKDNLNILLKSIK